MTSKVRVFYKVFLYFVISLNLLLGFIGRSNAATKNLTIFAEPNLIPALTELARIYSSETSSVISAEYGSSSDMVYRIEDGEGSDIFISSHRNWQDELKMKGLIDIYNVNHFADDYLVIVTSTENKKLPRELLGKEVSFEEALKVLNDKRQDLIVDHSATSLGLHSKSAVNLRKFNKIRVFKKLPEDISTAEDIISKNPNIFSLMLNSEVHDNDSFRIIAKTKRIAVFYQALVIAGENMENARQFSNFLMSKKAQEILQKNGFTIGY